MATPTFIDFYDNFPDELGDEVHDLELDPVKLILHTSVPTASWTTAATVTNELSNGTGYTTGGLALTTEAFGVDATDKAKFDSDGVTLNATGARTFSHWSLINTTADRLMCYGTCDGGSNIVLANGESFTLNPDATNGWFRIGLGTLS